MKTPFVSVTASSVWDAHAPVYEQVWERQSACWARDTLVLGQAPHATASPTPPRLLDVACGPGAFAIEAASMGYDVTATDFSKAMIDRVEAKHASMGGQLKLTTVVVDGETLEGLEDASFDFVTSIFGVFLFQHRENAWRSAWRVLKPGGRLVATSWDPSSNNLRQGRYLLENAIDKPGAADNADRREQMLAAFHANRTFFPQSFRAELEEAGLEDVRVHTVSHPLCFRSGEELVRGVLDNPGFMAMVGHKQEPSLARCVLDYAQLVLDGVDPFGEEAKAIAKANVNAPAQSHPLWDKPLALQALAHVAVATKPTQQ